MKRSLFALFAVLALASTARADDKKAEPTTDAKAEAKPSEADTLYAIGLDVAASLSGFELSPAELDTVEKGLKDAVAGKPRFKLDQTHGKAITDLLKDRQAAKGAKYLAKAESEKGAVKTASGLIYLPVKEGTGASPTSDDKVKVHYTGRLIDGKVFDSSVQRGQPAEFPLSGVIKCWTEGVQKMKVGGKARLICPSSIAYGDRGAGNVIPPGATLDFEVELLEIVK
jgi:FKBP-type peptidyl-prolyl cis-trans isomerase